MRPSALAALALVTAVVGGLTAVLVGSSAGWLADTETVVVSAPAAPAAGEREEAVAPSTRPVAGNGFDPARIYDARAAGVVTVYALFAPHPSGQSGQGSGFVVSKDGLILTNAHVITNAGEGRPAESVEAADRLFVEFSDRERVPATVVGWDLFNDVGVLRVKASDHPLQPVPLGDSDAVAVGEPVAAIGSPFGEQGSLSVGVVAATGRSVPALTSSYDIVDAIQTDAPINRGNSGGPLLDARGRVIGINAQIRSASGNAEGVGFAVPVNSARRSLEQLVERGEVAYAYVGVSTTDVTPSLAKRLGYGDTPGALIVSVTRDGPGRSAGLRGGTRTVSYNGRQVRAGGDLVVAIGERPIRSGDDLVRTVTERLLPGQVTTFTILRGERRLRVRVRLAERPADPQQ